MKSVDYIIVGQGLAGTLLAHDLLEKNQSVLIIDKPHAAMASKVAAGLFNPIGVKRCIRSWRADDFLPFAIERYKSLEKKLGTTFINIKPIFRLFANKDNRKHWQVKCSNERLNDFIGDFEPPNSYTYLKDDFGGASISPAGYLEVLKFLDASKVFFKSIDCFLKEEFNFDLLDEEAGFYKGIQAKKIIFCEGFRAIYNPYFKYLPFSPTKGEILTIRIPKLENMRKIVSKGVYILPLGNYLYRVGATYNHHEWNEQVTTEGITFLNDKIEQILDEEYEVVSEKAGVRPTVRDRKPFLGEHPKHKKLAIFNGLGTRGVIQGPYLSGHFTRFLITSEKVCQEADIQRYRGLL
tara:strand:- start:2334 stop:3386 length:1053 start_codon:yes stop_codon:yes gene_type:complete